MRYAVVTAYFREAPAVIERCIDSVRSQTITVEHILVADGHPQGWITGRAVRHIPLDRNHGDFGDTPRLVGLALAIREQFDVIQFLDADNLLYPRHAETAVALLRETGAHLAVMKRRFLRQDGSALGYVSQRDETLVHVDTNCYVFARPSFPTALKWLLIPRELAFMSDRVFRSVFSKVGHPVVVAPEATVGYTSMFPNTYEAVGEEPPPGRRDHQPQFTAAVAWWSGLDERERDEIEATLGVKISIG